MYICIWHLNETNLSEAQGRRMSVELILQAAIERERFSHYQRLARLTPSTIPAHTLPPTIAAPAPGLPFLANSKAPKTVRDGGEQQWDPILDSVVLVADRASKHPQQQSNLVGKGGFLVTVLRRWVDFFVCGWFVGLIVESLRGFGHDGMGSKGLGLAGHNGMGSKALGWVAAV